MDNIIDEAFKDFSAKLHAVNERLEEVAARAVDETQRDTAQRQEKHPLQSSTTLKESKRRAQKALAGLEAEHASTIQKAMAALTAIAFAKAWIARVNEAIRNDVDEDAEKEKSGLFKAVARAIQIIYEYGAGKHHWAQQSLAELAIYSDLIRWKAKAPDHTDPLSPWPAVLDVYSHRRTQTDLLGKRSRSLPMDFDEPSKIKVARSNVRPPSDEEMKIITEGWGSLASKPEGLRTEGPGLLDCENQYGGYLTQRTTSSLDDFLPMQLREDIAFEQSVPLKPALWNRIEVPRSVYALVSRCGAHPLPSYPQMYPPLARLRLVGVDLGLDGLTTRNLEAAEMGEFSSSIMIETVRSSFLKYNHCHDEDLIRFWLFLLVGRRYPERVDQLFPAGYFHGVWGPDISDPYNRKTHFQIVRVASDNNYGHMMRHPTYGPWSRIGKGG